MRWYHSIKVKLIGFFMFLSLMFMVTMFSVLTMLKKESLSENASKEVNLATIKILNNVQLQYTWEENMTACFYNPTTDPGVVVQGSSQRGVC